jgi:hypothetical protein
MENSFSQQTGFDAASELHLLHLPVTEEQTGVIFARRESIPIIGSQR